MHSCKQLVVLKLSLVPARPIRSRHAPFGTIPLSLPPACKVLQTNLILDTIPNFLPKPAMSIWLSSIVTFTVASEVSPDQ